MTARRGFGYHPPSIPIEGDPTMKRFAFAAVALLAAAQAHAGGVAWEKSFEEAKVKAGLEGRLMYLDFYTDW